MRRKSMIKKRKNIWMAAGTIIGCGLLCLAVHTKQHRHSPQQPDSHNGHTPPQAQEEIAALWHGTYQLGPFDEAEYIAVMPSSDPYSTNSQFQWYTIDDRILHEGACIPYESDRLRLFSDDTILAVLTCHDEQYYLTTGDQLTDSAADAGNAPAAADGSSSPAQKLLKISPEPIVCQPME